MQRDMQRKRDMQRGHAHFFGRPRLFFNTRTELIRIDCSQNSIVSRKKQPILSFKTDLRAARNTALILSVPHLPTLPI